MMQAEYLSPIGKLTLAGSDTAIVGLWLDGQKYFAAGKPTNLPACANMPVFAAAFAWLDRYFAGERPSPAELKLCPQGSAFQRRVWDMLLEIPYGETTTYGEIAGQIGCKSAQAVGGAVGHNPISIIVPCHRVLGADGSLTGYAGGVDKKIWLLTHEGAQFRA